MMEKTLIGIDEKSIYQFEFIENLAGILPEEPANLLKNINIVIGSKA